MCEITLKGTEHDPDPKGRVEPQSGDLFSEKIILKKTS